MYKKNYYLQNLITYFQIPQSLSDELMTIDEKQYVIKQLKLDSRSVKEGDLFVAIKGKLSDGRKFINQAIESGAVAILSESENQQEELIIKHKFCGKSILQINVMNLSEKIAEFADEFYDHPSQKMRCIAVTGTNGKTTITQLIAQWGYLLGKKTAVLGTLGNGIYGNLMPSMNTTSSSIAIESNLAHFVEEGVDLVAMEISSHGLALGRVKEITFTTSAFTNLTRDHLDFHLTMENYEKAKWSLFSKEEKNKSVKSSGRSIINFDDKVGRSWIEKLNDAIVVSALPSSLDEVRRLNQDYVAVSNLSFHSKGASILLESTFGSALVESHLFGSFNVSNLLIALAALLSLDFQFSDLIKEIPNLQPICGRMETFVINDKPSVIVDYAHTPDALDNALQAVKTHCQGKIWVVFGCGGDRDNGKRPLMARIAESYTEKIIITNDNPRTEDSDHIICDILSGFKNKGNVKVLKDRAKAIQYAIDHAKREDVILIAGKGHEEYQIIGETKTHFSDRETVCHLLGITL